MSSGKGLSIIALLIGISGLGLGIYTFIFPPTQVQTVDTNFGVQNTWYKYYSTDVYASPVATFINVNPLLINFTVNEGESVQFLYMGIVAVFGAGLSLIQVNFVLDGVRLNFPSDPHAIYASQDVDQYGTISLQTVKTISAGFHNITISIWGTNSSNGIGASTLLVQTFFP